MLILISPAKTLDFDTPPRTQLTSVPAFLEHSAELIDILKPYSPADLSTLMSISDKLAALNSTRYQTWSQPFTLDNAKQAVLAFKGDVYTGLDAESLTDEDDEFAQNHLRILSGLYGVLKPLDLIQPYRLEMGTALTNKQGKDLYQFWDSRITDSLNEELAAEEWDTVINLASNEYFKSVQPKTLNADIITPVFKDFKNGKYKVISFFAKKARGMMTRYLIQERITDPEQIKDFTGSGYQYDESLSSGSDWVFTRKEV